MKVEMPTLNRINLRKYTNKSTDQMKITRIKGRIQLYSDFIINKKSNLYPKG